MQKTVDCYKKYQKEIMNFGRKIYGGIVVNNYVITDIFLNPQSVFETYTP